MQNEAIRLSIKFFEEIKGFQRNERGMINAKDSYKIKVMNDVQSVLAGGIEVKELELLMDRYKVECPNAREAYSIDDVLHFFQIEARKGVVAQDPNNLIQPGKFYYHPRLQKVPPAPTIEILPDGTFKSSYEEEEFYLEIIERFTLEDLTRYFYEIMGIQDEHHLKRDAGAFKVLLERYKDLDLLMFTIIESAVLAEDLNKRKPRHPFELEEYIEDGRAILEERKNTLYMEGLDRVIPK